mmetsp:Transcript_217/g.906  ORF Transcript_217/g.906 Transcript_217/m.906 type:complete len:269 (-) Transcript_217:1496-2302(-)
MPGRLSRKHDWSVWGRQRRQACHGRRGATGLQDGRGWAQVCGLPRQSDDLLPAVRQVDQSHRVPGPQHADDLRLARSQQGLRLFRHDVLGLLVQPHARAAGCQFDVLHRSELHQRPEIRRGRLPRGPSLGLLRPVHLPAAGCDAPVHASPVRNPTRNSWGRRRERQSPGRRRVSRGVLQHGRSHWVSPDVSSPRNVEELRARLWRRVQPRSGERDDGRKDIPTNHVQRSRQSRRRSDARSPGDAWRRSQRPPGVLVLRGSSRRHERAE